MALGAAIRAARGSLTQEALAEIVKTDQPTISKWERGKQQPSFDEVRAIEDAAGLPHGFILRSAGYVDDPQTPEEAIRNDARLTDSERAQLVGLYEITLRTKPGRARS